MITRLTDVKKKVDDSNIKSAEINNGISTTEKKLKTEASTNVSQQAPSLPFLNQELKTSLETKTNNSTSSFLTREGLIGGANDINSKIKEIEKSIINRDNLNATIEKNEKRLNKIYDRNNIPINRQVSTLTNVYTDINYALKGNSIMGNSIMGNSIMGNSITSNFLTKEGYKNSDILLKIKQIKKSVSEDSSVNLENQIKKINDLQNQKSNSLVQQVSTLMDSNIELVNKLKQNTNNFTTKEGYANQYSFGPNQELENNNKRYLTSVQNQNKSLNDNINFLGGSYSSDNQKFLYEQQYILYWVAVNFWLFYIYMILAVVYGLIYFLYNKEGSLGIKILWYLHVFFYPYLAIYCEIAGYLFFTYLYCWFVGQPFTVWKYFTSYPPIV